MLCLTFFYDRSETLDGPCSYGQLNRRKPLLFFNAGIVADDDPHQSW